MRIMGWFFMLVSWLIILGLLIFCFATEVCKGSKKPQS